MRALHRRYTQKPPSGARANLGHPLFRGHDWRYYPLLEGGGNAQEAFGRGSDLQPNSGAIWTADRNIYADADYRCFRSISGDYLVPQNAYVTISYWWKWNNTSFNGVFAYHSYAYAYKVHSVYLQMVDSQTNVYLMSRDQWIETTPTNIKSIIADLDWHHFCWVLRHSSTASERLTYCYVDGKYYGGSTTTTAQSGGFIDYLSINGREDNVSRHGYGTMRSYLLKESTTPPTEAECLALYEDEWFAFRRPLPVWITPPTATAYTLTADAGSYTVTGTDAGLKAGRKIAATTDSYAVTGTAATLGVGYKIAASTDAYAITGTDAALKAAFNITASTDSYTVSGVDAGLLYGYKLGADAGAYAVTGADATLKAGRKVAADAGAYTLTGQDVTLTYSGSTYTLTADAGAYTVTGTAAGLKAGWKLAATTDSYTLTGQDATLTYSGADKVITADAGAYTLTGQTVGLTATRTVSAGLGSYDILGTAAGLKYGRNIAALAGAITITGATASLLAARKLSAVTDSYSITGSAATLTYSAAVTPDDKTHTVETIAAHVVDSIVTHTVEDL
jgi:hypothetical protein